MEQEVEQAVEQARKWNKLKTKSGTSRNKWNKFKRRLFHLKPSNPNTYNYYGTNGTRIII